MKYPHDPARVRQLLAEIGLKDTNGDGFLEDAEGHTVELSIVTNASNSQRVETAAFSRGACKKWESRRVPFRSQWG